MPHLALVHRDCATKLHRKLSHRAKDGAALVGHFGGLEVESHDPVDALNSRFAPIVVCRELDENGGGFGAVLGVLFEDDLEHDADKSVADASLEQRIVDDHDAATNRHSKLVDERLVVFFGFPGL